MKSPAPTLRSFALAFGLLFPCFAPAVPVSVGDPSFETNSITSGQWTNNLEPEWKETGGPNNGSGFEEWATNITAADGTDHLGMMLGHDVWQDLAVTYQANTRYTLTVAVGNRPGTTSAGNDSRYLLADSTGVIYATGSFNAQANVASGTFADAPALVFDTPNTPAAVGKTIRILLQARGVNRSHFDNIRLDATSLVAPGGATVANLTADSITTTTATIGGEITNTGVGAPSVTMFHGTSNGGLNPGAWQNSVALPGTHTGTFSTSIGGLAPGTVYWFTARATNAAGSSWVLNSSTFETLPLPPVVAHLPPTSLGATTATLGATITSGGTTQPATTIYYGTTDGGTNPAAWSASVALPAGSGNQTAAVSGLVSGATYFFRAISSNPGGSTWAPASGSFTTLVVSPPVVSNRSPDGITGTTATLRGEIDETGNDAPVVTLFLGTTDGGTNPAAWTQTLATGTQSGEFTRFVQGLLPNTLYFYRWRAVNAGGTAWSEAGSTFSTVNPVAPAAVINEFHYNSDDNTSLEEFVELHNPGDSSIDVSGWQLSDAVTYTIPGGTTIPAGGFLVIGENPATLASKFGVTGALGPWTGRLSSAGERIDLLNAAGIRVDRVEYGAGFPWPTAADGAGPSAELMNPGLDNNIGGSWRSSGALATSPVTFIPSLATAWKYKKGNSEASTPDVTAWRAPAFDDSSWLTGNAGFGYGYSNNTGAGLVTNTTLSDMRFNYSTVYFRKAFTVNAGQIPQTLSLRINVDDGYVVWINGHEVVRNYVQAGQLPFNAFASDHSRAWDDFTIPNADNILLGGTNVIAVHVLNTTLRSSDLYFDLELKSADSSSLLPTPGAVNSVRRALSAVPPAIRQVAHAPVSPKANEAVTITARITDPDGMGAVSLAYQLVNPGSYIRLTDAAYATTWTTVAMNDAATAGDLVAGDGIYTVVLPASLQTHRRLVRYRITFADALGNAQTVPYADDEQPNFAYFVYNGVPAWTGKIHSASPNVTYPAALLESKPPLHILANASDMGSFQAGNESRFRGTVVTRGVVHDHIEYRARGQGSTTVSGKNKWNIYFNRARDYQAYDNYGRPYAETWNNLLVNANASPWASVHRGSAGVEEAVSNRIFSLGGVPSMHTHFFHLRVIDNATEAGPTQYDGDFWGLYLGLEPTEGNFIDERGLPDGNIYAIEANQGDKKRQGPTQPVDSSDWNTFRTGLAQSGQTQAWYEQNVDLDALYTFLALNRLIGNVDVRPGDNYRFYHRPTDDRWVIIPYDLDMMFIAGHHWGGTMDQIVNGTSQNVVVAGAPNVIRAISRHPGLARAYRNRCREILSLMASDPAPDGGQIGQLFDEYARFVHTPGQSLTWANLDAAMWNLHPETEGTLGATSGQSSHKGNFFRANYNDGPRGGLGGTASTSSWIRTLPDPDGDGFANHEAIMQWFVDFSTNTWPGGTWNRKAMTGIGTGTDTDANRQKGYGYKYLEWEALNGGWINCLANPAVAATVEAPDKPTISATGDPAFPVSGLAFNSGAFSDPQGNGTFAAWQWRIARISAPGLGNHDPGAPRVYELESLAASPELTTAPGAFTIPFGIAEVGNTYRVRVRHKDSTGNWSLWSDPVQFTAAAPPPSSLIHYWNFNDASPVADLLVPTQTAGGGALSVSGVYESGTGQSFSAPNARFGDDPASHLRVNNPIGQTVRFNVPTTGFADIVVKYETRRSGQGAGSQIVDYTINGTTWTNFASIPVVDGIPTVETLDFRPISAADNNPQFAIRITFQQAAGGTAGNNRFDNFTVEGGSLSSEPILIPSGNAGWNFAENWTSNAIPDGAGAEAIIPAPGAANRDVTLSTAVAIGSLEFRNAGSAFRNRLAGTGLVFDGDGAPASLIVSGTGTGFTELEVAGGVTLATDLRLDVTNIEGDPVHGALRLRAPWSGPGGLIKQGSGIASLTGDLKSFTGPIQIQQGVLQFTESAAPTAASGIAVSPGGQLRLTASSIAGEERLYTFGGPVQIAGSGRGPEIPTGGQYGVLGALRYDPENGGVNLARVSNPITVTADADIHVDGPDNTLVLSGSLGGPGNLFKSGGGRLVLSGNSPSYTGLLAMTNGPVTANGDAPGLAISIGSGQILSGAGRVGTISGSGTVAPHLTTLTASQSSVADADFVFTQTGAGGNSHLRLVGANPLPVAPGNVDLFLNVPARADGDRFRGGFFADQAGLDLSSTSVRILVPDAAGSVIHQGVTYRVAAPGDELTWAVVSASTDFGSGPVTGQTIEILVGDNATQFNQWKAVHFPNPGDLANPLVSGPLANPSGDGVSNLMRYAHGVGPFDPVLPLLPVLAGENPSRVFRFRYDAGLADLRWFVRAGTLPGPWTHTLFDSETSLVPPLEAGWLPLPVPPSLGGAPLADEKQFLRLEVELVQP